MTYAHDTIPQRLTAHDELIQRLTEVVSDHDDMLREVLDRVTALEERVELMLGEQSIVDVDTGGKV